MFFKCKSIAFRFDNFECFYFIIDLILCENASKADDFVNTIGVNVHVISYKDGKPPEYPYGHPDIVKKRLSELGVRFYRTGGDSRPTDWPMFKELYDEYGIKPNYVFTLQYNWTIVADFLKTYGAFAESFEGPNERDWDTQWNYHNKSFPENAIEYQNDLYKIVKETSTTSHIPVLGPTVARPTNHHQLLGCKFDYVNIHSYPG